MFGGWFDVPMIWFRNDIVVICAEGFGVGDGDDFADVHDDLVFGLLQLPMIALGGSFCSCLIACFTVICCLSDQYNADESERLPC